MRIGGLTVEPVYDGMGWEPAREFLDRPGDPDPWSCHPELHDERGNLDFTLGGFLVRTGERTILIDAGVGAVNSEKYRGGQFLESLRELGANPEDVTDVLFTHLHFDHVGWATQKGEIVFPNATHRVHAADWAYFIECADPNPGAWRKLSPLTDRLELFDADTTIATGVDTLHAPGHTPGSTIVVVSSDDQRMFVLGDVAHCTFELTDPTWEAVYDLDRTAARGVRERLAHQLTDQPDVIAGGHFSGLRFGRLVTVDQERRFAFL
ncbi:MBL fold metallo-hydrolase [Mycolicibacterium stellerae]|uniref:MBL fold metallo-hydrolase n=1 Tax=Mycolicibacterium stellerae TaxID=2358193 RepID=UPI000F0B6C88|nr:MBL fold metallo-hydrolase [Mycolicibacterium stellerae]